MASKSRPARWNEAVATARKAQDAMRTAAEELQAAFEDIKAVQEEYEEWKDGLPENLQSSPVAEKLEAICSISLDWTSDQSADDAEDALSEAEGADFPLGFGKD